MGVLGGSGRYSGSRGIVGMFGSKVIRVGLGGGMGNGGGGCGIVIGYFNGGGGGGGIISFKSSRRLSIVVE